MKLTQRQTLSLAIGSAILAILFAHAYLSSKQRELASFGEEIKVVVAKIDILEGMQVNSQMVESAGVPKKFVQPGALFENDDLRGRVTIAPIKKGEQITDTKLVLPSLENGIAGVVSKGMRAVTIAVDDISGVGGFIRPADIVDVLATFDFGSDATAKVYTYTILEGVEVIAAGYDAGAGIETDAAPRPLDLARGRQARDTAAKKSGGLFGIGRAERQKNVTLLLAPQDVQKITLAEEVASLKLSLRNPLDNSKPPGLEPATTANVTGLHELLKSRARPMYKEYKGGR